MEFLELGEMKIRVATELSEISIPRCNEFKKYALQIFYDLPILALNETIEKCKSHFNNGKYAEMIIELENLRIMYELQQPGIDAWGFCFALITLSDNENWCEIDRNFLKDKYFKFCELGLKQDQVENYVSNFIKGYPKLFQFLANQIALMKVLPELLTPNS